MNNTLLSIILGIGGMVGWGIYDFLGGIFAKGIGSFRTLFWSQLVGAVAIALLALIAPPTVPTPSTIWLWLPVAAGCYAAGYIFLFRGFAKGNITIVAATMNLWAVFTIIFAFVLMGQRLSSAQSIGVVLIIVGATLAAIDVGSLGTQLLRLSLGVSDALIGALFFGVFLNISELVSEQMGWLWSTLAIKIGVVGWLLVWTRWNGDAVRLGTTRPRTWATLILMGVIELAAVACVNYGLTIGDAILITPISSALSVVAVP
ncbi:MAG: DMT family transporter, partial [Chloroflexi bacterium]|nr:DMT family transporter [Chloroflexota bacterium]